MAIYRLEAKIISRETDTLPLLLPPIAPGQKFETSGRTKFMTIPAGQSVVESVILRPEKFARMDGQNCDTLERG